MENSVVSQNVPIDVADTLFYSDDPESLSAARQGRVEGVLFDFDLVAGPSKRFLYYHVNGDAALRYLCLRVLNAGDVPATFRWLGTVPPATNAYIHVGHAATAGFLDALAGRRWNTVHVAAGENLVMRADPTSHGSLVTGIFEFVLDAGTSVRFSLVVATDPSRAIEVAHAGASFPPDGKGRAGRFDIADKTPFALNYTVGSDEGTWRLGVREPQLPNQRSGNSTPLVGEYGVISTVAIAIDNPTNAAATVALYESARGGASTGSYLIEGRVVNSQAMIDNERHKLWTFEVPGPGKVRATLLAIPDSGSSSPVELILGPNDGSPNPGAAGSLIALGPQYVS